LDNLRDTFETYKYDIVCGIGAENVLGGFHASFRNLWSLSGVKSTTWIGGKDLVSAICQFPTGATKV
jgi:hypothetical protein